MYSNTTKNSSLHVDCSAPTLPSFTAQATFLFVILIVTIIGNLVVFMTVMLTHSLRFFTNYIVASLAVSDLLVGGLSLPFRIHQTLHNTMWCLGRGACRFWVSIDLFCCSASVCNLALISLDRFLATKYPLTYHEMLSRTTQAIMISSVWIYAAVVASSGLASWTYPNRQVFITTDGCFKDDPHFYTFAAFVGFFLPLAVILLAYSYVFQVSVSHWRAIRRLTVPAIDHVLDTSPTRRNALTREIKAAKTLAIVVGAFVVCWAPFFMIALIKFWCKTCFLNPSHSPAIDGAYAFVNITFIYTLPNINSTLNPFIYVIFSKTLRQAFLRIFTGFLNRIMCCVHGDMAVTRRNEESLETRGRTNAGLADEATAQ